MIFNPEAQSLDLIDNCICKLKGALHDMSSADKLNKEKFKDTLRQVIESLLIHQKIITSNKEVFIDLQHQIMRLSEQKERFAQRHIQILQNLEILLFQKDYQELKGRITEYKKSRLQQTYAQNAQKSESNLLSRSKSSVNTFNQAFYCDSSERSDPFDDKVKQALEIINNQNVPFEKKENNSFMTPVSERMNSEAADLHHVTTAEVLETHRRNNISISEFSEISATEAYDPHKSKQFNSMTGKKIKSMIALKQNIPSNKKRSLPKTSIKKKIQTKQNENAEISSQKFKKRLQFPSKDKYDKSSKQITAKKKVTKIEPTERRTTRKTILNAL